MKIDNRNVLRVLEKETKGISQATMEELRELFGPDLTFVDAINMLGAVIHNADTAQAIRDAAENNKPDTFIFYDVKEVAEKLKCSIPTAREIMNRKDFPSKKIANSLRVSRPAFEQWSMQKELQGVM